MPSPCTPSPRTSLIFAASISSRNSPVSLVCTSFASTRGSKRKAWVAKRDVWSTERHGEGTTDLFWGMSRLFKLCWLGAAHASGPNTRRVRVDTVHILFGRCVCLQMELHLHEVFLKIQSFYHPHWRVGWVTMIEVDSIFGGHCASEGFKVYSGLIQPIRNQGCKRQTTYSAPGAVYSPPVLSPPVAGMIRPWAGYRDFSHQY